MTIRKLRFSASAVAQLAAPPSHFLLEEAKSPTTAACLGANLVMMLGLIEYYWKRTSTKLNTIAIADGKVATGSTPRVLG